MMNRHVLAGIVAVLAAVTNVFASAPQVIDIVDQADLGAAEFRCSIAVDSLDQPHVVTTEGSGVHFYDKVAGAWRADSTDSYTAFGASQYGNPHMEIVADRAWISGVLVGPIGVILRENMAVTPTPVAQSKKIGIRPFDRAIGTFATAIRFAPASSSLLSSSPRWSSARRSKVSTLCDFTARKMTTTSTRPRDFS